MVYLAPAYIARNHPHFKQILLVNAFGGWTILLWAIALYWSLLSDADSLKIEQRIWGFFAGAEEPAPPNGSAGRKDGSASMADKLLELDKLRKNGLITEDDFNMTKRSLLDKNKEA
jgi:hypothetical protein